MTDLGRWGEVKDENNGGSAIMDGGEDGKIGRRKCAGKGGVAVLLVRDGGVAGEAREWRGED